VIERKFYENPFSAPRKRRWKCKYLNKKKGKRMKLVFVYSILAVLLVLLVCSATCTSALAADYGKVGVKVGNTADYETSITSPTDYNRTHVLVYGIVGTTIYLNLTYYHPDGTVGSESQLVGDVFVDGGYLFAYLLAANLTAGDSIYSGASMVINETTTMTFAGTSRTVNHLRTSDGLFEAYWDKATGLMTKLNFWLIVWTNMTIISTDAWSAITPPPPVAPPLSVKLSGEFDYSNKEDINVRLAALVKDANTLRPVSGAHVIIEIYHPNGTLWISGNMLEKLVGTGIYEWESSNKIDKMKLKEGVYLVHVKAFLGVDPTASDMLLFHIDPPAGSEDPLSTTMSYYVAAVTVSVVGAIVGIFLARRHERLQAETAHALKLTNTK
jgi:hypothetical protein